MFNLSALNVELLLNAFKYSRAHPVAT